MNKVKPQTTISSAVNEPKSSMALTLEKLNKEMEKKEAAAEKMRTRCKICFKELTPKRLCGGHGGGGGGSEEGEKLEKEEQKTQQIDSNVATTKIDLTLEVGTAFASDSSNLSEILAFDVQSMLTEKRFNPEIIAQLVADGILVITLNRESKTLSIELQLDPESLSEEQRIELKKYIEAILAELDTFKALNRIVENCVEHVQDEQQNTLSLHITLPTLTLYDAFIQQLAENLLPTSSLELQSQKSFAPNPFSIEPKPTQNSKNEEDDEDEQDKFNPSPASINLKPW